MKDKIRKLAEQIATGLFTNGSGTRAEYLMLTDRKPSILHPAAVNDLGSWSEKVVADRIEDALRESEQIKK